VANDSQVQQPDVLELRPDALTHRTEANMRRLVFAFRLLGWFWMLLLVVATLATDDEANKTITLAAMALATVWTAVTWWAARHRSTLGSAWFVALDGIVALIIASASYAADAGDLFHGGYPISWIAVAAYGGGLAWALPASLILGAQQAILLLQSGRSAVAAVGSIVFIVYALILGYLFSMIRTSDLERRRTEARLTAEREENARRLERLELANRLHDSALQTLQVIDSDADDPERVRSLARRQSRELRGLVNSYAASPSTLSTELERVAGEIESLYGLEVSLVVRAEAEMDATTWALLEASREAMTNAAKHADVDRIDVYAATDGEALAIHVRDVGRGFDVAVSRSGHGLENSIVKRIQAVGGDAQIASEPGHGTEVTLTAPLKAAV
jgi:signal transduction histidine kinase